MVFDRIQHWLRLTFGFRRLEDRVTSLTEEVRVEVRAVMQSLQTIAAHVQGWGRAIEAFSNLIPRLEAAVQRAETEAPINPGIITHNLIDPDAPSLTKIWLIQGHTPTGRVFNVLVQGIDARMAFISAGGPVPDLLNPAELRVRYAGTKAHPLTTARPPAPAFLTGMSTAPAVPPRPTPRGPSWLSQKRPVTKQRSGRKK